MNIRNYTDSDYDQLMAIYDQSELYGGQRNDNRDSKEKIQNVIAQDPESIIIAEDAGNIVGTVSLIEDGRVAWLFRFAALKLDNEAEILKQLQAHAINILKSRGHNQVLVYSPSGNSNLDARYAELLGFERGNDYTAFWKDI
jgi:ribosomal protein S18 acetylase RimI-like enzyme